MMRQYIFLLSLSFWLGIGAVSCFAQQDSVKVFFIGNIPHEKFKVFWDGKLLVTVKGSKSYKYEFTVPRDEAWIANGFSIKFMVYRKGLMGLKYRQIGTFNPNYESKKYLVIWRNPWLKKRAAIQTDWSDKEPNRIPNI